MYRTFEFHKHAGGRGIAQIACDVHSTSIGSYDRSYHLQLIDVSLLHQVLDEWRPTTFGLPAFDESLKQMIEAAIEEFEQRNNIKVGKVVHV